MTPAHFAGRGERLALGAIVAAAASLFAPIATAQSLSVDCFAPIDCQRAIKGALTPKLVANFPPAKYKLVIFGSAHRYTDTAGAAYAVAGVSERVVHKGVDLTVLPLKRYSASAPIDTGSPVTEHLEREALERAVRAAVERMASVCAKTPDCAVYKPYR